MPSLLERCHSKTLLALRDAGNLSHELKGREEHCCAARFGFEIVAVVQRCRTAPQRLTGPAYLVHLVRLVREVSLPSPPDVALL